MGKQKCSSPYTKKIKTKLKKDEKITPIIESLLNELERIEKIQNSLYLSIQKSIEEEKITEEYTNKAKATNEIINPAIKEYKAYSQRFNDLIKTIASLTGSAGGTGANKTEDAFETMRKRRMQNGK